MGKKAHMFVIAIMILIATAAGTIPAMAQDDGCVVTFRVVNGTLVESAAVGDCEDEDINISLGASEAEPETSAESAETAAACEPNRYTVVSGDTLSGISSRYGVTVADLMSWNSLNATSVIHPNDQLVVSRCVTPFNGRLNVEVDGVIDNVDQGNVLMANFEPFVNTIGLGSELILAEPGVLLTHDATEAEIQAANGAIDRFSPLTQIVMNDPEQTITGCGEGRFVWAVANTMTAQIEDVTLTMNGGVGENSFMLIRCRFSDEAADTDAGSEITFTGYSPGFGQIMLMPKGAFISEEAFLQAVGISTSTFSCGSESCTRLNVLFFDVNTDAFSLLTYTVETGWQLVDSNVQAAG